MVGLSNMVVFVFYYVELVSYVDGVDDIVGNGFVDDLICLLCYVEIIIVYFDCFYVVGFVGGLCCVGGIWCYVLLVVGW